MKRQLIIHPCDQEHGEKAGLIIVSKWGDNTYRYPLLEKDTIDGDCCYPKEVAEEVWDELQLKADRKPCGYHPNRDRWIVVTDIGDKVRVFPPLSANRQECCFSKAMADRLLTKIKQEFNVNG